MNESLKSVHYEKTRLFIRIGIAVVGTGLPAQAQDAPYFADELLPRIDSFFLNPQFQRPEKLWLHLDKPYYAAGDKIWFKGYLVNAISHRPDTLPTFIYVDLADRDGKIVLSKKIKRGHPASPTTSSCH